MAHQLPGGSLFTFERRQDTLGPILYIHVSNKSLDQISSVCVNAVAFDKVVLVWITAGSIEV